MSLTVIILGSVILLVLLAVAFSSQFLFLIGFLADVLNLGHLFNVEPKSSLDGIFYNYRHSNIKAWAHWVSKQPNETQKDALNLLLKHLNGDPGNWGLISPQAVKAIAVFLREDEETNNLFELISIVENISKSCKRYWGKFKVAKSIHQACWETMIMLDQNQALVLFQAELNAIEASETEILSSMASALRGFKKEANISDLISEMLTHSKINYQIKKQCIELMEECREEEENKETIVKTFKNLIKYQTPMDPDDLGKVLSKLLIITIENIDDELIQTIVQLCEDEVYRQACIQALAALIKKDPNLFEPELLYCFISSNHPSINTLIKVIGDVFALSTAELEICINDAAELTNFKTNLLAYEKIKKFKVIAEMKDHFDAVKDSVKTAQSIELTLISGDSENDKLYLARAVAAEQQYSFLYAKYMDLQDSDIVINDLEEKVQLHKPLLIYISEIDSIFETMNHSIVNKIKKLALDSRIQFILTTNLDLGGYQIPQELHNMLNRKAIQIPALTKIEKNKLFKSKLNCLQAQHRTGDFNMDEIVDSIYSSSRFEFNSQLDNYFRAGLLSTGRVINMQQYNALENKAKSLRGVN